jgi:hypothetical protein
MKKLFLILTILTTSAAGFPYLAQAGISEAKSFKLSVTIPESVQQRQEQPTLTLVSNNNQTTPTSSPTPSNFQLVEAVRDHQKIILKTFVVD